MRNVLTAPATDEQPQRLTIDELRRRCAPYLSPIDVLRCTLDEALQRLGAGVCEAAPTAGAEQEGLP